LIKVSHKVVGAKWIDERQVWEVKVTRTDGRDLVISSPGVTDGETNDTWIEECDIFVNSGGFFNNWKWPQVPGRESFKGRSLHTAYWPEDADKDIDGKTVAIIGNGSSGIQVLPAILDRVKKVYVHIRSPTWITARIGEKFAGNRNANLMFSEEQKKRWTEHPEEYLKYRKDVENDVNVRFLMYMNHTPEQEAARKFCVQNLKDKLEGGGKPELLELMTPDFAVG
jgi:cation diffusion facilitator CzcD-associated flavoprotein CzcO